MTRRAAFAAAALLTAPAFGAYFADFDTIGAATDWTQIHQQNTGANKGTVEVSSGGDDRMDVWTNRGANTTNQVRFIVAPELIEGAEVALPIGLQSDAVRTEARLSVTIESNTAGTVTPFSVFGFGGFDSTINDGTFMDKLVAQLNDLGTQVTLRGNLDNNDITGATIATLPMTATLPDSFEMQVTADKVRLLLNGTPMTSVETDAQGWATHNLNLGDFDGDALIPVLGEIRAASAFGGTTNIAGTGFDDIGAQNVPVPEPASLGLLAVAGLGLRRRRR
jgi:hypothetical protein